MFLLLALLYFLIVWFALDKAGGKLFKRLDYTVKCKAMAIVLYVATLKSETGTVVMRYHCYRHLLDALHVSSHLKARSLLQ